MASTSMPSVVNSAPHRLSGLPLGLVLDSSPVGISVIGLDGIYDYVNHAYCTIYGYTREELLGEAFTKVLAQDLQTEMLTWHNRTLSHADKTAVSWEGAVARKDGTRLYVLSNSVIVLDENGVKRRMSFVTDITANQEAKDQLRNALAKNSALISALPDLIFTNKLCGEYLAVETTSSDLLVAPPAEIIGKSPHHVLPADVAERYMQAFKAATLSDTLQVLHFSLDLRNVTKHFEARVTRSTSETLVTIVRDVTQRAAADEHLQQMAFFDTLTQLPNRRLLSDRLEKALAAARNGGHFGALLFLDLDNFKPLNDTWGHAVGDQVLAQVASRLKMCVRQTDTVARMGGDEFVVILGEVAPTAKAARHHAEQVAEKILQEQTAPFELGAGPLFEGVCHQCTASIGAVLFSGDETQASELLRLADRAMYAAKSAGGNTLRFYDSDN